MLRFVFHYYSKYKKDIVLALLLSLLNSFMTVVCSQFLKDVIKGTLAGKSSFLAGKIAQILCLTLIWVVVIYSSKLVTGKLSIQMTGSLRQDVIEKIMNMRYDYLMGQQKGTFLNKLNEDISDVSRYFEQLLFSVFLNGISVLVILVYLFATDWKLTLISMIWIPFTTILYHNFLNSIADFTREKKKQQDALTAKTQELFECYETEKSYNLQEINLSEINTNIWRVYQADLKRQKKEAMTNAFSSMIRCLPVLFCSIFAAGMVIKGALSAENFISFLVLLGFISSPISNFTSVLVELNKAGVSADRLRRLLEAPEESRGGNITSLLFSDPVIQLQDICFSYDGLNPILNNLSFELKKGERIAFVGGSGSGKTTLMNLILGLFEPQKGNYFLYGTQVSDLDIKLVRGCFSIVSQETFLFPDTIEQNLLYGNRSATRAEIEKAAGDAGLASFIESLPEGYDTVLEENGVNLSGGQRQKFAIARALLRNSEVIIFDEPTSALDPKSEKEITELIETTLSSKTIISVAHKLNTVLDYDRIYLMDHGNLKEQGSHQELLGKKGLYYQLFHSQNGMGRDLV
ncbi:ABC transporter ATP-binding protein [Lacrimispora defluvii]|uniref:ABC transporter ATP-binding protein n=1 Tax=Lacrimispora defluvii TaxID=2719233 RepID=A0ABX1VTP9_9FIRM|nr:ABC transporter ATP-binding protein [Lacrimispora defluvii]NNJ31736.1 ABC transporter ATP-binding protein [Lacrimispora defluvii]